ALVGGSLYSTAREASALARMVLNGGRAGGRPVLSRAAWGEMTRRPFPRQAYGLGWGVHQDDRGVTTALCHAGALAAYRSVIFVDLRGGRYLVAHWTLRGAGERWGGRILKAWRLSATTAPAAARRPRRRWRRSGTAAPPT